MNASLPWRIRRSAERPVTRADGITSRHGFSFGTAYDPTAFSHGWLTAHNEEVLAPGSGFSCHSHRAVEIVTWVIEGSLEHHDSLGNAGILVPGMVQVLSAGTGVEHSERNPAVAGEAGAAPCRFIQMWISPLVEGGRPGCRRATLRPDSWRFSSVVVASGMEAHLEDGAVPINQPGAALHVVRLHAGQRLRLPNADKLHLFLASGSVELGPLGPLSEGDSVWTDHAGDMSMVANQSTEILLWEMQD